VVLESSQSLRWEYGSKLPTERVQLFELLSKSPADLHSGLSCSWYLLQTCAEVSVGPIFDYTYIQIGQHSGSTSKTAGDIRSTWDHICRLWKHFDKLQWGPEACWRTWKYWWDLPECVEGLCMASGPIFILLVLWQHIFQVHMIWNILRICFRQA